MSAQPVSVPRPASPSPVVMTAVVGEDALSREGLVALLRQCPGVGVLPDASTGSVDVLVVVTDRLDAGAFRTLRVARDAAQRVVLVVADVDVDRAAEAVTTGAVGLLRRADLSGPVLAQVVRAVASGEAVLPPDLLTSLLDGPARTGDGTGRRLSVVGLDDREVAVLELLSGGSDTREIALRLCYSERTVKAVIQDITHRFGLRNRSHAVAYALRHGLI